MSIMVSQLWDVFTGNSNQGVEKVAALTEDFLRDRIRETSVCNRVIPPILLTEAQIERNTTNDWPLKRVEIEPDSIWSITNVLHLIGKFFLQSFWFLRLCRSSTNWKYLRQNVVKAPKDSFACLVLQLRPNSRIQDPL